MSAFSDEAATAAAMAIRHPLVVGVMAELRDNLGVSDDGLPAYGIAKVANYAAQVAFAVAYGVEPDVLRLSKEEANSELLRRAAEAVGNGIPTYMIDLDGGTT